MNNQAIIDKLYQDLSAELVELTDNSWRHAGHQAMAGKDTSEGTHLHIRVVSSKFDGLNPLDRHRMVHQALQEAFAANLHALELKTMSPEEWKAYKPS